MSNPDKSPGSESLADDVVLPETDGALPPLDFTTFVLSLAQNVLMMLGLAPGEEAPAEPDLPMARQTIDLIGLLHEKTRGNLSGEEERLLDQVHYDLRIRFSEVAGRSAKKK